MSPLEDSITRLLCSALCIPTNARKLSQTGGRFLSYQGPGLAVWVWHRLYQKIWGSGLVPGPPTGTKESLGTQGGPIFTPQNPTTLEEAYTYKTKAVITPELQLCLSKARVTQNLVAGS